MDPQYCSTGRRPGSADRCRGGDEEDERGNVPADARESSSQGRQEEEKQKEEKVKEVQEEEEEV